jgi:hypothetical protein
VFAGAATASDGVYFPTARGQQSIEYLLMVARAHLLTGARVVEVGWECPFSKVVGLSCRMNATLDDPRLPGVHVLGKIVNYAMTGNGDSGEFLGKVTINCAVGNADPILTKAQSAVALDMRAVINPGTPVYVVEGYVDPGYQHYAGKVIQAATADTSFEELAFEQTGLQLPVTADQILVRHEYHDPGAGTYNAVLETAAQQMRMFTMPIIGERTSYPPAAGLAYSDMVLGLNQALDQASTPAWVEMEFKPVQNIATSTQFQATVGALSVPKQINLAAS